MVIRCEPFSKVTDDNDMQLRLVSSFSAKLRISYIYKVRFENENKS